MIPACTFRRIPAVCLVSMAFVLLIPIAREVGVLLVGQFV
jgi:hypothetical protein